MTTTRRDLRQRIGGVGYCGDMFTSTATGGSTSTLIDTTHTEPDDVFNYAEIVILDGTAAGDYRTVSSWVNSTSIYTPDRNFTSTGPAAADTYELHRVFSATQKNAAISQAILDAKWHWARRNEDESITMVSGTYTYSLAAVTPAIDRYKGIDRLLYNTGATLTGYPYEEIDKDFWRVRDDNGTLTLQFLIDVPNPGRVLRLEYRIRPSVLTDDTTALDPDIEEFSEWICARATALLWRDKSLRSSEVQARDEALQKSALFQQQAERIMAENSPQKQPGEVIYPLWGGDEGSTTFQVPASRIRID